MKFFTLVLLLLIGCGHKPLAHKPISWDDKNISSSSLRFLSTPEVPPDQNGEEQGFVSVPIDHNNPEQKNIEIFYRLIPCSSCQNFRGASKPIIVIINDGPGHPSSLLTSTNKEALDSLLKNFRLVLIDQRGTGYSSPLDFEDPDNSPQALATFFNINQTVKDSARVIEKAVAGESFYLMGVGFGGLVLYKYMFEENAPQPRSFIFANSGAPPYNFLRKYRSQRHLVFSLNNSMQRRYPSFKDKVEKLRKRLQSLDLDTHLVHSLYTQMGGEDSHWQQKFYHRLKELLSMEEEELQTFFSSQNKEIQLFNYLLSAQTQTPKMTKRNIYSYFNKQRPTPHWMIDGLRQDAYIGNIDKDWKRDWIQRLDRFPPPPIKFPNIRQLSLRFQRTPALFIFGRHSKSSGVQFRRRELRWFKSPKVQVVEVPGTGNYIFTKGGAQLLKRLLDKE